MKADFPADISPMTARVILLPTRATPSPGIEYDFFRATAIIPTHTMLTASVQRRIIMELLLSISMISIIT